MFGLWKKEDPKKGLERADKALNKGVSGLMTRAVMGKEFMDDMNASLDRGRLVLALKEIQETGLPDGLPATAEVTAVQETGMLIAFNPVVVMQLRVQPEKGTAFDTTAQTIVSKAAVPGAGDTLNIRYNPNDPTQIFIV